MIKRYIAPLIVLILVAVISGLVWTKAPEFKGYILPTAVGILVFVGLIWALFPKIKRYMMPAIILILVVAVAGGLVWFNFFRDSMIKQFFATMQQPAAPVSTYTVKPGEWMPEIEAIGTVSAIQGVELSVEVAGIVKDIPFKANQTVEKDAPLLQLDDAIEKADIVAARAQDVDGSDSGACPHAQYPRCWCRFCRRRGAIGIAGQEGRDCQIAGCSGSEADKGPVQRHSRYPANRARTISVPWHSGRFAAGS